MADAPSDCVIPFRCTDTGYFPDPLNCSRYHLCSAAGASGSAVATYECPNRFVYNPATTMCKLSSSPNDCAVIDCSYDPYGYVLYPADKNFFASCSPEEDPLLLKCPQYHVFVPTQYTCVSFCENQNENVNKKCILY